MSDETVDVNEMIARNIRRLRDERNWSQPEVVERLNEITPEGSWNVYKVSRLESDEAKRARRRITADEMLALARVFDVSLIELWTPPKGVKVQVGLDSVSPDLFLRLAFMLPPNAFRRDALYRGTQPGQIAERSELGWRASILKDALEALYTDDELRVRFPGVEQLGDEELGQLYAEDGEKIGEWIIENHGVEVFRSLFFSERTRDLVMDEMEIGEDDG